MRNSWNLHYINFGSLSHTGVYISVNNQEQENNSCIDFSDIAISADACSMIDIDDKINDYSNSPLVCHVDTIYYNDCQECNEGEWYYQSISNGYNEEPFCVTRPDDQSRVNLYAISELINLHEDRDMPEQFCCIVPDIHGINQTYCVSSCKLYKIYYYSS